MKKRELVRAILSAWVLIAVLSTTLNAQQLPQGLSQCTSQSDADCLLYLWLKMPTPAQTDASSATPSAATEDSPLTVTVNAVDNTLAVYVNSSKVFNWTIVPRNVVVDQTIDLTRLLLSGRDALTFVSVNTGDQCQFDILVNLGNMTLARYSVRNPAGGATGEVGPVSDASIILDVPKT